MRTIPKSSDAALRARGLRLTGPRRVILEVLRGTDSHPTAEWVYRFVRRRLPRVSLGTVYRNLRLLVAEGLAAEIPGSHVRFDANTLRPDRGRRRPAGRAPRRGAPRADRGAHRARHHAPPHRVLRPLSAVPVREGPAPPFTLGFPNSLS
ncbi:MAG: ferric-uptake regulator [Candidatus Rokubacteria bacterium]|nr:ferric-uptake regulator [Candidatus Rokubacteria bacterium]